MKEVKTFLKLTRWFFGLLLMVAALPPAALFTSIGMRDTVMKLWSRLVLGTFGVKVVPVGDIPAPGTFVVLNHVSYFDPLVVGALAPGSFVAKSEIEGWALAGLVARIGLSIFVNRQSVRESRSWIEPIKMRLRQGSRVHVFAEGGIIGDGVNVELFKTMFFQAPLEEKIPAVPVALRYVAPADREVWCWNKGSMKDHLFSKVLPSKGLVCEVRFGEAIIPEEGMTRKDLAALCHAKVSALYISEKVEAAV